MAAFAGVKTTWLGKTARFSFLGGWSGVDSNLAGTLKARTIWRHGEDHVVSPQESLLLLLKVWREKSGVHARCMMRGAALHWRLDTSRTSLRC